MTANYGYVKSLPGALKIVTIVLAGLIILLSYLAYFLSDYTHNREEYKESFTEDEVRSLWREYLLMGVSAICLVVSTISLLMHCRSMEFWWKKSTAIFDFLYHCLGGLALGAAGILFIVSAVKIYDINCTGENGCQLFELKLGAGALGMISCIIYGVTGAVVMTRRKDVEREALMADGYQANKNSGQDQ